MRTIIFQALEFTVLIPGMLLAYLPVNSSLKQKPKKMIVFGLGAELDSKRTNLFRQVEWFAFTG